MKVFKSKRALSLVGVALLLIVGFQNCSQSQFAADSSEFLSKSTYANGELNTDSISAEQNSGVDTVTPRIVLSDTASGSVKKYFSPNKIIYGTVYGVSEDAYVCIGWTGCDLYPGYNPMGSGSTASYYGRPAKDVANWRYQQSDGTWRFTLDYSAKGATFDRIVVHDLLAPEKTGSLSAKKLRLEQMVYLKSTASDAMIYFPALGGNNDPVAFSNPVFVADSSIFMPSSTLRYPNDFTNAQVKIAGLGANIMTCYEKAGSGHCNTGTNWVDVRSYGTGLDRVSAQGVYYVAAAYLFNRIGELGPVEGSYTLFAQGVETGKTITKQFNASQTVTCAFRPTQAVIGPCSDPEQKQTQCTKSNVGQTVQGTGSCRATYVCQCN